MGNWFHKVFFAKHEIVGKLTLILGQVIGKQFETPAAVKMKNILSLARAQGVVVVSWEELVESTLECMRADLLGEMLRTMNPTHQGHVFVLYAVFVDMAALVEEKNEKGINVWSELLKLQTFLRLNLDTSVLRRVLNIVEDGSL